MDARWLVKREQELVRDIRDLDWGPEYGSGRVSFCWRYRPETRRYAGDGNGLSFSVDGEAETLILAAISACRARLAAELERVQKALGDKESEE